MSIRIEFQWEVEDGYINHGPHDAYLELSRDEAQEAFENPAILKQLMEEAAEVEFENNVTWALSNDDTTEQLEDLKQQLAELDEEGDDE